MNDSEALAILNRYSAGVSDAQRLLLLTETSITRTVAGQLKTYFNPYDAALAHLLHPDTIKARTEGEVSETYIDLAQVISDLKARSAALVASLPPDDAVSPSYFPALELDIRGWG